jgi:hypothetical protein
MGSAAKDNGQAKIFYSVVTTASSVPENSKVHVVIPGAGSLQYGWSYTALAMLLSQRGCSGKMDLYDPDTENCVKVVGNFAMNYYAEKAPKDFSDTVTHVMDDTWPSALSIRAVVKLVAQGAVVSMKANVQVAANKLTNEASIYKLPCQIFHQPFYSGAERRIVYNYKPRPVVRSLHSCSCYDCLKMQRHPLLEEEWHHLVGFGVRPCSPVSGRDMIQTAYPYYTGQRDFSVDATTFDLKQLPKINKYLATLEGNITPRLTTFEERITGNGSNEVRELWCSRADKGTVRYKLDPGLMPFIVANESVNLVRGYLHADYFSTDSFTYVSPFASVQRRPGLVGPQVYTTEFSGNKKGSLYLAYGENRPQRVFVRGREVSFHVINQYANRDKAYSMLGRSIVCELSPPGGGHVWALQLCEIEAVAVAKSTRLRMRKKRDLLNRSSGSEINPSLSASGDHTGFSEEDEFLRDLGPKDQGMGGFNPYGNGQACRMKFFSLFYTRKFLRTSVPLMKRNDIVRYFVLSPRSHSRFKAVYLNDDGVPVEWSDCTILRYLLFSEKIIGSFHVSAVYRRGRSENELLYVMLLELSSQYWFYYVGNKSFIGSKGLQECSGGLVI